MFCQQFLTHILLSIKQQDFGDKFQFCILDTVQQLIHNIILNLQVPIFQRIPNTKKLTGKHVFIFSYFHYHKSNEYITLSYYQQVFNNDVIITYVNIKRTISIQYINFVLEPMIYFIIYDMLTISSTIICHFAVCTIYCRLQQVGSDSYINEQYCIKLKIFWHFI